MKTKEDLLHTAILGIFAKYRLLHIENQMLLKSIQLLEYRYELHSLENFLNLTAETIASTKAMNKTMLGTSNLYLLYNQDVYEAYSLYSKILDEIFKINI